MTQLDSLRFSYPEAGATRSLDADSLGGRYLVLDQSWQVGSGRHDFEAASECLMTLDMQRVAGLTVAMAPDLVEAGSTFRLGIGIGWNAAGSTTLGPLGLREPARPGSATRASAAVSAALATKRVGRTIRAPYDVS